MMMEVRNSPNRNIGRQGNVPDFIVCHITDGAFDGAVSWAMNPASQVSYHFIVARDGRVVQLVNIENTAWANGTTNNGSNRDNRFSAIPAVRERSINANLFTISIGFEGRFSETNGNLTATQLNAGVELAQHIRSEVRRIYNFEIPAAGTNIVGHHQITPITRPNCPGFNFPFDEFIYRLAAPGGVAPWALNAWLWAIENKLTDGTRPTAPITRQETVTLLYRLHK